MIFAKPALTTLPQALNLRFLDSISVLGINLKRKINDGSILQVFAPQNGEVICSSFNPQALSNFSAVRFDIDPSKPQWRGFKRVTLAEAIENRLGAISKNARSELSQLIAEFSQLYSQIFQAKRVEINLFKTFPQGRTENYPGEGIHYDTKADRMYVSFGPGMQWVTEEIINPDAMKIISKGRDPESMFLVPPNEVGYNQIKPGEIVIFDGTKVPHRTPFCDEPRAVLIIDRLR